MQVGLATGALTATVPAPPPTGLHSPTLAHTATAFASLLAGPPTASAYAARAGRSAAWHGEPGDDDTRVYWIHPTQKSRGRWASDPFKPMVVKASSRNSPARVLGEVTAADDHGFATLLGEWVRTVPYLRATDTYVDPSVS